MNIFVAAILCLLVTVHSASCQVGEYKEQDDTCSQCHSSCSTCYASNACATCYDQMYLYYTESRVICQVCYLVNEGCQTCITAGKCLTCTSRYFLQADNTCTKCDKITNNCLICRTRNATSYCVSCQNPYKLINEVCVGDSQSQNNNTLATQASPSQQATQSLATVPISPAAISPASVSAASIICNSNEILINNNCWPSIAFCQQYKAGGECQKCYFSFPVDNGKCLPTILAISQSNRQQPIEQLKVNNPQEIHPNLPQCTARQYYKLSQSKCIDVALQCKAFKPQNGQCTQCIEEFYVFNGFCAQKAIPPKPQQKCSPPCLTCRAEDNNFCLSCEEGFVAVDQIIGQCFKVDI